MSHNWSKSTTDSSDTTTMPHNWSKSTTDSSDTTTMPHNWSKSTTDSTDTTTMSHNWSKSTTDSTDTTTMPHNWSKSTTDSTDTTTMSHNWSKSTTDSSDTTNIPLRTTIKSTGPTKPQVEKGMCQCVTPKECPYKALSWTMKDVTSLKGNSLGEKIRLALKLIDKQMAHLREKMKSFVSCKTNLQFFIKTHNGVEQQKSLKNYTDCLMAMQCKLSPWLRALTNRKQMLESDLTQLESGWVPHIKKSYDLIARSRTGKW
uniref:Uncharacterized protein n=2 Tax=Clytia hemisphaerica TaxID=252671 RepID=A0A7M5VG82_9CNID